MYWKGFHPIKLARQLVGFMHLTRLGHGLVGRLGLEWSFSGELASLVAYRHITQLSTEDTTRG